MNIVIAGDFCPRNRVSALLKMVICVVYWMKSNPLLGKLIIL